MTLHAAQITADLRRTGHVLLDAREYVLSESIQIPAGATLEGQGFATRLHCTGDFPAITMALETTRPAKVTIRNLRITRTNTLGATADQFNSDGIRIWGTDVLIEDVWTEDCYKHIAFVAGLGSVSQDVIIRRVKSVNTATPIAHNSHSGIYLGDCDRVKISDWAAGASWYPWLYNQFSADGTTQVTNIYGVARMFTFTDLAAANTSGVHGAIAGNNATSTFTTGITNPATPRNVTATFGAAWDGGNITIVGTDQFDQPATSVMTANPGGSRSTFEIYKTITSIAKSAVGAAADAVTIGWGVLIGVPVRLADTTGALTVDGVSEVVTIDNADCDFSPTTAPNGAHDYIVTVNALP